MTAERGFGPAEFGPAEMDRRSFLHAVPAGAALAGLLGAGGAVLLGGSPASAAPRAIGTLSIPKLKLQRTIYAGIGDDALNKGIGHGLWSPAPGGSGHSQLFGHRTSKGGPLRNVHKLKIGDAVVANGLTYRVRRIEVISVDDKKRIWAYDGSGPRLSLIACSKANGLPTSLKYRICIRANA